MLEKEDTHRYEVSYKFLMPDAEDDLKMFQKAYDYFSALCEIYEECRRVYKYDEEASEETCEFAEKIASMCDEAGIFEVP